MYNGYTLECTIGYCAVSDAMHLSGVEIGDQIPHLSPHVEVRKIGDLTYENIMPMKTHGI